MKALKAAGRVVSGAFIVLLAVILGCNLYTIAARNLAGIPYPTIFGYYPAIVISGSMSGSIEVNDMVIVHQQDDYHVGDVVAYKTAHSLVTHRIVDETDQGFVTKGDANNAPDRVPVSEDQILGKVVSVIPGIGVVYEWIHTPLGMCSAVLLICFIIFIPSSSGDKEEYEQNERSLDYEG